MAVRHWQNHQPGLILLLTDPDCALESAKSVSTWTGSHARDGVINLILFFPWFIAWLNLPIPHE